MATFTSIPQTASFPFKHFDPSSIKRTQSKSKAKVTGYTLNRDRIEGATHALELLHQDSEGDIRAVPLQVQAAGRIEDVEMDSTMCDLFGASHRTSMYDLASGDDHYQFGGELLDEERMDHATRVATPDSATNRSLYGSSRAANEGGHVGKHGDLDAAVEHAFSVGDVESPYHERSPAEDRTFFGIVGVTDELPATRKRSRQFSVIDATTIPLAAVPTVIPDLEPEDPYPAKRQRLAERQEQSPILEPAPAPKSSPLLDLSGQASCFRVSDSPISGPLGAAHEGDGGVSRVLPLADLRDEEDDDANVQATVEELLKARSSIPPSEEMEGEQDVGRDSGRREMNRQGSGSKVGRTFEEELNHNNETYSVPPATFRRSRRRNRAPVKGPGLSDTAIRPRDCNTVLTRAKQPQQKVLQGWPKTNKGPRPCSSRSSSLGTTAGDRNNIKYGPSLDKSCQMTDITLCAIPNGSSVVSAIVHYRASNRSLDLVALGRKCLGEQGKVIRMIQLSPDSCMLVGYQYDDNPLGPYTGRSLNAHQTSSSHSDTANYDIDHSDHDWDKEEEIEGQGKEKHSQRTHIAWQKSDEARLLSLKDKQGMEWKDIFRRFPERSEGAVKVRYYMLHKKD
ncbi:hypothetical protein EJ07DRAFT_153815 [Lizonia empirigonia]|nr:hypothetical protein EJ07DRAFT_153815 [Lizonia empirigonia]